MSIRIDMGTVIFDFDSTLIDCESLEEILKSKGVSKDKFESITKKGMEGKIPFVESLKMRLALAPLTLDDFKSFGIKAIDHMTQGIDKLIDDLQQKGVEVWIISGSFKEAILPLADKLKIPKNQILALDFFGPYEDKQDQARGIKWNRPVIIVGDGMTDYELVRANMADRFIVFTRHIKRDAVVEKGEEAKTVEELRVLLNAK